MPQAERRGRRKKGVGGDPGESRLGDSDGKQQIVRWFGPWLMLARRGARWQAGGRISSPGVGRIRLEESRRIGSRLGFAFVIQVVIRVEERVESWISILFWFGRAYRSVVAALKLYCLDCFAEMDSDSDSDSEARALPFADAFEADTSTYPYGTLSGMASHVTTQDGTTRAAIQLAALSTRDCFIDLGCGVGRVTNLVARIVGCAVVGIDCCEAEVLQA